MTEDDDSACYTAALKLLNYKWRSEKELDDRLRQKGFDPDAIATAMARLREEKWLDDKRFATEFVRSRRGRNLGRFRISQELQARGINREQAKEATAGDPAGERQHLVAAATKRINALTRTKGARFVASAEGRRKLAAYLLRQGYDFQSVLEVLDEQLGRS